MSVTVSPEQFSLVLFESGDIHRVASDLLERFGMADVDLVIEVDETSPLARIEIAYGEPLTVRGDSGSFEDPKRPRHTHPDAIATSLGRVLLRARDRASGTFDDAPADAALTLAQSAAWDTYSMGRLAGAGYPTNRQRWLYNFRNRHGFSDVADETFDRLWQADGLSWAELDAASAAAVSATGTAAAAR
jgi:hypothetical protein